MAQKPLSILISGAGVAGASLAWMLARHPSFKTRPIITLVERSPAPRVSGQAIDIRGPAVDVIEKLGLEPEIKSRHTSETGFALVNDKGHVVAQFNATGDAKQQTVTSEYEILRGELTGLLLDGVNEAKEKGANVNVVYGESISTLDERSDGVNVTFANGKLPQQTFDAVIAADGYASRTRSMIFGSDKDSETIKQTGRYVAFCTIPRVEQDDKLYKICHLPDGMAMHLRPHRDKETMGLYLSIFKSDKGADPEIDAILRGDVASQKVYLRKRFEGKGWQINRFLDGVDATEDFYMTNWCHTKAPIWTRGRCTLLGDTAYAVGGIGTSLALTGAFVIAGELSKIESAKDVPAALQAYETVFRPYVDKNTGPMPAVASLLFPQTAWGVSVLQNVAWVLTTLRVPSLAMRLFGRAEKEEWRVEDYGWSEGKVEKAGV